MEVIIDRFEGDNAVVELPDRTMLHMSRMLIPNAREGDVVTIMVDSSLTQKRRKKIEGLMNKLFQDE